MTTNDTLRFTVTHILGEAVGYFTALGHCDLQDPENARRFDEYRDRLLDALRAPTSDTEDVGEELEWAHETGKWAYEAGLSAKDANALIDRILALLPTEGEPVAWAVWEDYTDTEPRGYMLPVDMGGRLTTVFDEERFAQKYVDGGGTPGPNRIVPLYTTPQESTEVERENKILRKKLEAVERMPFCPDHRDKLRGKPCRECEVERLRSAYDAAVAYIDESPCDPDITAEQWKAWERFVAARAALNTETDG